MTEGQVPIIEETEYERVVNKLLKEQSGHARHQWESARESRRARGGGMNLDKCWRLPIEVRHHLLTRRFGYAWMPRYVRRKP